MYDFEKQRYVFGQRRVRVQRFYAPLPATLHPQQTPQYLSNHRLYSNQNPTQESALQALSNAPSFVQFHAAVLEIAFTHNISTTTQDIATPKDSLDARRIDLKDEPYFTEIHAAVIEQFTKE